MTTRMIPTNDSLTHAALSGPADGPLVVFSNALGTDMRIWDPLVALLPPGLRVLRYDLRGHGQSEVPPSPYGMATLVRDLAALMDTLELKDAAVIGLSIGGMIAQGLAAERPDLVRAMVLMDTAAKIGTEAIWEDRIASVAKAGLESQAEITMEHWFSADFRRSRKQEMAVWRHMLTRCPAEGYMGCAAAIAQTDLMESTSRLRLPTLGMGGSEDRIIPPDLARETSDLVPGSRFALIRGAAHLSPVEAPQIVAPHISAFLDQAGF